MPVILNDSKVLLNDSKIATSEDCCCGCTSCDDLPTTGEPPPSHINVVITYSGGCGDVVYSGSIMYDHDLAFAPVGPIGGHFFCLHNIFSNSFGEFWTGHFTRTCTLDGTSHDFGSIIATGGFLGRDFNTCEWWFELDTFFLWFNEGGLLGTCTGCGFSYPAIFEVISPPGDPSGVYVFVLTDSGITLTITVTIT